jgi:uncharacterized protein (TIGR00725 family)
MIPSRVSPPTGGYRKRLPIVGVMGSGTSEHAERAEPLGRWLAALGTHLLTGGGGGVMAAVSRGFHGVRERRGIVIGVIPGGARSGYPNPWVELPIFTHLPLTGERGTEAMSRNHVNVLSSDVIVALPGGAGTASEVRLALRYRRPLIAYVDHDHDIPDLPPEVPRAGDLEAVAAFVRSFAGDASTSGVLPGS